MKKNKGFTLLELMLVILVIGVMAKIVVPSITWGSDEDRLSDTTNRFKAVFDLAAEYAMINNYELGLIIKDDDYRFVAFDGTRWANFAQEKYFEPSKHEEGIELKLELEGLEWAENNLLNEVTFQQEDAEDEDKEMLTPQIYILSSGDITPFRLTFTYEREFEDPIHFQAIGDFTAPIKVEGPLEELP
jgi:general secretion pathway protein H